MSTPLTPAQILAAQIATAENNGTPGTNNPGNLAIGDIGSGTTNGVTNFPSITAGFSALEYEAGLLLGSQTSSVPVANLNSIYPTTDQNLGVNVSNQIQASPGTTLGDVASFLGTATGTQSTANTATSTTANPAGSVTPGAVASSAAGSMFGDIGTILGMGTGLSTGVSTPSTTQDGKDAGLTTTRVSMIVLGFIMIAAGVFSFKQTQTIIQTAGKYAAKASTVAA